MPWSEVIRIHTARERKAEANGPRTGVVTVATNCWSCNALVTKSVVRRTQHHRQFAWTCNRCEVGWSGPGRELPSAS
jgi:hypothetical protein